MQYLNLISQRVKEAYNISAQTEYSYKIVSPYSLLTPYRIDVLLKIYYINAYVKGFNIDYAKKIYLKQVFSITSFTNKENGQVDKNSQDKFVSKFNELIDSFIKDGYNSEISLIPVSHDNIILDGAHRLACAVYFNCNVATIQFHHIFKFGSIKPFYYDYKYFEEYLLNREYIDIAVQQYIEYCKKNVYIACIWPVADDKQKKEKAISIIAQKHKIIYKKECVLSYNAFCKLIAQVYLHDSWVGNIDNDFSGSQSKAILTYKKNNEITFIVFEDGSKEDVLEMKDNIRAIFKLDKHSIHITDNTKETKFITDIVLNKNSLDFLEYSKTYLNSNFIKEVYNLDSSVTYNVETSKIVYGLTSKKIKCKSIQDSDLRSDFSVECINTIPETYYVYLNHRFIVPRKDILDKYFIDYDENNLLNFKYNRLSHYISLLYNDYSFYRKKLFIQLYRIKSQIRNLIKNKIPL